MPQIAMNTSEARNPKSETNSRFKCDNVPNTKGFCTMPFFCFGVLNFENLVIVSMFDIRISSFPLSTR
jgi:hypothetical protein